MHNFVVSQNNAISVHKIVLHSLVPIFYIYFDHTNFFIFYKFILFKFASIFLEIVFLNILVAQVWCSPRRVQVTCGGTTSPRRSLTRCAGRGVPAQGNDRKKKAPERKLPVKPGRK